MKRASLECIFYANRDALLRFLKARNAADEAEDILQDLWIRIVDLNAEDITNPLPYLYRAANNILHDRQRIMRRALQRDGDWRNANFTDSDTSNLPLSDRILIAREQLKRVEQALEEQGPRLAYMVRRFRVDGIGQRQIAEEMQVSLSTVEKDLRKAFRLLLAWREEDNEEN